MSATLTVPPKPEGPSKTQGRRQRIPSIQIHLSKNKIRPARPQPLTGPETRQIKPASQRRAEKLSHRGAFRKAFLNPAASVNGLLRARTPHVNTMTAMRTHTPTAKKVSSSFLKKRTKKLLQMTTAARHSRLNQTPGPICKSFLVLFFKKELLTYFPSTRARSNLATTSYPSRLKCTPSSARSRVVSPSTPLP